MCRVVGLDGPGKAQWLGVQEVKSEIFVGGWGGGIAFIFGSGGLNRTIRPVEIAFNMTIKCRTTGCGLKRLEGQCRPQRNDNNNDGNIILLSSCMTLRA